MGLNLRKAAKILLAKAIPTKTVTYRGMTISGAMEDYGFLRALADGNREEYMTQLFVNAIHTGATVVDIGAHIGQYSILAAETLRSLGGAESAGKVHAFEVNPRCFNYLRRNVATNHFQSRISCHQRAVADRDGIAEFLVDTLQSDFSSLVHSREKGSANTISVEVVKLDSFLPSLPCPEVFKIDVEGAELQVLAGAANLLSRKTSTGTSPIVFIEANAGALAASGASNRDLVLYLQSLGFSVEVIDETQRSLIPFDDVRHGGGCFNLRCQRTA